jgi:hypothetical protein
MSSEKNTSSRRRLLKKLAIGGGVVTTASSLPEKWKKPVIESVITPAHAQTSKERD